MTRILTALALASIDIWILLGYRFDPSANGLTSILLAGTAPFLLFGLLCVFACEKLGAFTGPVMRGGYVSYETPAGFFVFFGLCCCFSRLWRSGSSFSVAGSSPSSQTPPEAVSFVS